MVLFQFRNVRGGNWISAAIYQSGETTRLFVWLGLTVKSIQCWRIA